MTRRIEILLESRGIRAVAELLDEEAPKTCEAGWQGLPQSGPIWHAKFANNEIFILTRPLRQRSRDGKTARSSRSRVTCSTSSSIPDRRCRLRFASSATPPAWSTWRSSTAATTTCMGRKGTCPATSLPPLPTGSSRWPPRARRSGATAVPAKQCPSGGWRSSRRAPMAAETRDIQSRALAVARVRSCVW
jgi:hypothetical protein